MKLLDYLNSAEKSLFRFESLQDYKVDDEDMSDVGMRAWWDFIVSKKYNGVMMQQVRLVTRPFTSYTKKELEIHKKSLAFGDDIKVIEEDKFKNLKIRIGDFWLVDDRVVLKIKYSDTGEYQGFDVVEEGVKDYIIVKNFLLDNSTSL